MNLDLALTSREALFFLPLVLPICLWVMYTDLKDMKILNIAVIALFAVFVVLGPFALQFDWAAYGWRFAHVVVVLAIGFLLSVGIGIGAGDAKFAAAMAPFVALSDAGTFLVLLAIAGIVGLIKHRIAKRIPAIRNATPDWVSWQDDKTFPWGVALAATLVLYLVIGLLQGG